MEKELHNIKLMDIEWEAWKEVCAELKRLGVDINEQDDLNELLVAWGNKLSALRIYQKEEGFR